MWFVPNLGSRKEQPCAGGGRGKVSFSCSGAPSHLVGSNDLVHAPFSSLSVFLTANLIEYYPQDFSRVSSSFLMIIISLTLRGSSTEKQDTNFLGNFTGI